MANFMQSLVPNALAWCLFAVALQGCTNLKSGTSATTVGQRPNIIFILADDLGYGDVGCYGQKDIATPNIDALASQGMRFTQAYAGATVCAPSRCSLMTGLHGGHAFIRGNALVPLRPEDRTVAEVLKDAGYTTALIGKWGLGEEGSTGVPNKKGFDYFYGYLNQHHAHNSWPTYLYRNEARVKLRNVVPNEGEVGQGVATEKIDFSNDLFTGEILSFLGRDHRRPFFLYAAYTAPHANNEGKRNEVPDLGIYKDRDWPEPRKAYAALITRLDQYVGQIMAKLRERGLDENTIVFFTSDNGPHKEGGNDPAVSRSSGPLRGIKRDLYDGGIRVPMIARWPGRIPAGATSDQVWAFWDFLPTAAELAGTSAPKGIDGISMLPTLLGIGEQTQHEYLYWEFHEGGFKQAIRMGDWKAVRIRANSPIELYNLKTDPGEQTNLSEQYPELTQKAAAIISTARTDSIEFPIKTGPATRASGRRAIP